MVTYTWDDLAIEFDKATEAFGRCIKSFESITKSFQEMINYCRMEVWKEHEHTL